MFAALFFPLALSTIARKAPISVDIHVANATNYTIRKNSKKHLFKKSDEWQDLNKNSKIPPIEHCTWSEKQFIAKQNELKGAAKSTVPPTENDTGTKRLTESAYEHTQKLDV